MTRRTRFAALLVVPAAAVVLGVLLGSEPIAPGAVLDVLLGGGAGPIRTIVIDVRLPRVLLALVLGGGLALAGATFQALLRNPLAEPYILGVSGGAAVGAVTLIALGVASTTSWALPLAAFAGALVAIVLVFRVAAVGARGGHIDVRVLLLAGVVVGAFFSAVIAMILALSQARTLQSAVFWMMGSLTTAGWSEVAIAASYTFPAAALLLSQARALNAIAVGEESALYLGVEVERVKWLALVVASLVTAAGVAVAGIIGFVGLVVPHLLRLVIGADHRVLLPMSILMGGAFLALSDILARTIRPGLEIPIGVVTAFVGVPIFLVLLRRSTV
ncbi:MAG: iron ABC transporter permease [Longimicrobiales bacterium]|nr:iron ABC transporter permease [Longimicrobiales bacterium]